MLKMRPQAPASQLHKHLLMRVFAQCHPVVAAGMAVDVQVALPNVGHGLLAGHLQKGKI